MRAVPRSRRCAGAYARAVGAVLLLCALTGCGSLPAAAPTARTITPSVSADGAQRVRLDHRGGAAPSPAPVAAVPRGSTVELVVGSDVAERVTLQGYDWTRYVTAGSTVTLRFVVDRPGEVVVTIGDPGTVLGRLQVR